MDRYDVIVVGAGAAGLSAAVAAREAGARRVLVLEKASRETRGGNTRWSGGALRFAPSWPEGGGERASGSGPKAGDEVGRLREDLMRVTGGRVNPELLDRFVNASGATVAWLVERCRIVLEPCCAPCPAEEDAAARRRLSRVAHQGLGLSRALFRAAEEACVEIRLGARALDLILNADGAVRGVSVMEGEAARPLAAPAIVLAAGGFQADPEMRARHLGELAREACLRGSPHDTGDGHRMALAAGAAPAGDWSGRQLSPVAAEWDGGAPPALTDRGNRLSYPLGVMLNREGRRFVDEGEAVAVAGYGRVAEAILAQPGAVAWQIFDAKTIPLLEPRYDTSEPVTAETLERLVESLDLRWEEALRSLTAYNAGAREAEEGFDPSRRDGLKTQGVEPPKSNWALKIASPPFRAYRVRAGIGFTFGGVRANSEAEALTGEGRPVRGLYVCGEVMGGLLHGDYLAGISLTSALVFGRIAGRNAAGRAASPAVQDDAS